VFRDGAGRLSSYRAARRDDDRGSAERAAETARRRRRRHRGGPIIRFRETPFSRRREISMETAPPPFHGANYAHVIRGYQRGIV